MEEGEIVLFVVQRLQRYPAHVHSQGEPRRTDKELLCRTRSFGRSAVLWQRKAACGGCHGKSDLREEFRAETPRQTR